MSHKCVVLVACCFALNGAVFPAWANTEVEQLKKEVEELKKQVEELKKAVDQQQVKEAETRRVETLEQKIEESASTGVSRFTFKPYGFIKMDTAYDDSRTTAGNFVLYIPNESTHKNDNEFNMTARQSRLGLDIVAPALYDWEVWGRVEIDFYGDGAKHENKGALLLRHAFVNLTKGNFSFLAGQTSDLISPLYPNTLNYTVGWSAGNIGYRRPQLRATYTYPFNQETKLISALAISRTTGTVNEDFDLDLQNDGEDAGFPTVQARLALATKLVTRRHTIFGLSGHYGKEEIDQKYNPLAPPDRRSQHKVKSWSINGDFDLPLTDSLSVKGEAFIGYNLDDYFGGILQGINPLNESAIRTTGGWMQLTYKHGDKWNYNLGLGIDDPRNDDVMEGMRNRNSFYFANVVYSLIPPVDIGVEYSYWDTQYEKMSTGTDNRIQGSVIYKW